MTLSDKEISKRTQTFRDLHVPGEPFILANAWDIGSAKMLAAMGAKAIASTSAGHAFTIGLPDMGYVSRDDAIDHARVLNEATSLPVNGDLENGYGNTLDDVKETVIAASESGIAGLGIEDTDLPSSKPYPLDEAVERIAAAVEAKQSLSKDIVLTARADGLMNGHYDLAEAIKRVKLFEQAGADVIYIPIPADLEAIGEICRSVSVPVNVLCAGRFTKYSMQEFANSGVARVSLGSALIRATHKTIFDAASAMFNDGDMTLLGKSISGDVIDKMLNLEQKPDA